MTLADCGLLADEQGLGKTIQVTAWLDVMRRRGQDVLPALVVCPNSVKAVWRDELSKWAPDLEITVVGGSAGQRRKALSTKADVFIINWEALRLHTRLEVFGDTRLLRCSECGGETNPDTGESLISLTRCETHEKELNQIPIQTVICDEAHRMADGKSKQTRAAWWVMHRAKYRYALTGTPAESNIGQLWPILHGIDKAAFPGKTRFLDLFAMTTLNFWGGFEVLGLDPARQGLYYRITQPYIRRMLKTDVLPQLPAKTYSYRYPEMSPKQHKAYKSMADDMVAHLEELVAAGNPLTQTMRLRQFACATATAHTNTDTGEQDIDLTLPSCKIDDFMEWLDDEPAGEQVVVAAMSKKLIKLLAGVLDEKKISYVLFTGDQSTQEREGAIRQFQSGQARLFLMTIAAGGEGITLTAASTMFFLQQDDSRIKNSQAEDRVHRIGQQDSVRIIISVTADSIEQRVLEHQGEKAATAEELTSHLRWLMTGERG